MCIFGRQRVGTAYARFTLEYFYSFKYFTTYLPKSTGNAKSTECSWKKQIVYFKGIHQKRTLYFLRNNTHEKCAMVHLIKSWYFYGLLIFYWISNVEMQFWWKAIKIISLTLIIRYRVRTSNSGHKQRWFFLLLLTFFLTDICTKIRYLSCDFYDLQPDS